MNFLFPYYSRNFKPRSVKNVWFDKRNYLLCISTRLCNLRCYLSLTRIVVFSFQFRFLIKLDVFHCSRLRTQKHRKLIKHFLYHKELTFKLGRNHLRKLLVWKYVRSVQNQKTQYLLLENNSWCFLEEQSVNSCGNNLIHKTTEPCLTLFRPGRLLRPSPPPPPPSLKSCLTSKLFKLADKGDFS